MAELEKFKSAEDEFRKKYFQRNREAEENRQKESRAATRIQSWFRACKVRAYLRYDLFDICKVNLPLKNVI
uniref:Uncharacterized protein n=1 Tax=Nothobranchius furzeri TaxID=105023 RepID=A0A8C6NPR4_NOTFU